MNYFSKNCFVLSNPSSITYSNYEIELFYKYGNEVLKYNTSLAEYIEEISILKSDNAL